MPSKRKKYNARFPPARIKKIMQTDEEVGKVAAAVPVVISRALELFIESLITKSNDLALTMNAKILTTSHIKQVVEAEKMFDFLRDTVSSVPDLGTQQDEDRSEVKVKPIKGTRGRKTVKNQGTSGDEEDDDSSSSNEGSGSDETVSANSQDDADGSEGGQSSQRAGSSTR